MIEIKNLKKSFDGNVIFDNVNLNIEKGDSVVIIGGSGCGKSTLLRCINRLITPDCGEIYFDGQNILDKSVNIDEYRRKVGMVFQQFNLFSHLNVMENMILAPVKVLGMPEKEAIEKAEHLLKSVAMENRRYRMPSALSGGQKQRVAIARTLMMDPEAILFDEPTSALDPTMVDEVENVIRKLVDDGMTSIIVTHEMRFAKNIASKVVFLADKGIYECGTPEQIFDNPSKELTRQFVYRSRMFSETVDAHSVDYFELSSKLRAFASAYGLTRHQAGTIEHVLEEILLPLIKAEGVGNCNVYMGCEESGENHRLYLVFPGLKDDPLTLGCIDEIGLSLVRGLVSKLESVVNGQGLREIEIVL